MPGLRADLVAASAPKGPGVITETLIRNGIQASRVVLDHQLTHLGRLTAKSSCPPFQQADDCKASSPELRRSMSLAEVQSLAISFQCIGSISNLQGLTNLTKLALDNNGIKKIENLDHLVCRPDVFMPNLC